MSPLASIFFCFFLFDCNGFLGQQSTYIHNSAHRGGCMHLQGPSPLFFWFWIFPIPLHHFPFSSLPPCLDAIWKHCNFQEIPLVWKHISEMVVEALGHLEQQARTPGSADCCASHRQTGKRGEAGQIGKGRLCYVGRAVELEIVEAVNDAVVRGMGLG